MLLAIDIGTSSAKILIFDPEKSQIVAAAGHEYPVHKPAPDRAEQNPEDWWQAVVASMPRLLESIDPSQIRAIGLTGQMHGTVLLAADHKPLHPAIIWADQRSGQQSRAMIEQSGEANFTAITGTLPAAGFMGATLLWLLAHQPELIAGARHVILPKDYLRLKLTGEIATDPSDAASTALFDVRAGDWASGLIEAFGLPLNIFPKVLGSAQVAGQLTASAAAALGLPVGIPVVTGCADQPAQALTNGLVAPGVASVTTGTGGQVFVPLRLGQGEALLVDSRLHVFNHALPDRFYALGAILSAGLALRWLRGITGLSAQPDAYALLSAEAARVPVGADGLIFLPYLVGERTPHMDPAARGAFIGLGDHHGRGHLARAVMEGVAFALRQTLEISLALGEPAERIIAAGGGAESALWRGIQADIFGLPLQKTLQAEQTSLGAALLAGVGTGVYADLDVASAAVARHGEPTQPNPHNHQRYNQLYEQFLALYPRLREDFHNLTRFSLE